MDFEEWYKTVQFEGADTSEAEMQAIAARTWLAAQGQVPLNCSVRMYLAAQALDAVVASTEDGTLTDEQIEQTAEDAVKLADALLRKLGKP